MSAPTVCVVCGDVTKQVRVCFFCYADAKDARPGEWRPMTMAPKDGTPIMACRANYETDESYVLHPSDGPITVYWGTYHPNSPGKGEWRDGSGHRRPHLTHWMPLPEPPDAKQEPA